MIVTLSIIISIFLSWVCGSMITFTAMLYIEKVGYFSEKKEKEKKSPIGEFLLIPLATLIFAPVLFLTTGLQKHFKLEYRKPKRRVR